MINTTKMLKNILGIILLTVTLAGCLSKLNGPEAEKPAEPGRRDYEWTFDTLKIPPSENVTFLRMWGSSPDNIWIGAGSPTCRTRLWHYDGKTCKTDSVFRFIGEIWGMWGTSANDVWFNSVDAIWHYNGTNWSKHSNLVVEGYNHIGTSWIAGKSSKDICCVGDAEKQGTDVYKAALFHYDGEKWYTVNIPDYPKVIFDYVGYNSIDDSYIITATDYSVNTRMRLFCYNSKGFSEIDMNHYILNHFIMEGNVYLSVRDNSVASLYKVYNKQMIKVKDFAGFDYRASICGRSENDLFGGSAQGLIHYNGTDMQTVFKTDINTNCTMIFENDVIITFENNFQNYILHGKLKQKEKQ